MHPWLALGLVAAESGLGGFDAAAAENTVGASQHACFGPCYHGSYLFPLMLPHSCLCEAVHHYVSAFLLLILPSHG